MTFYHNAGTPGDGARIREGSPRLSADPGTFAFIEAALVRLIGPADYTFHRESYESIHMEPGDLVVNLYDIDGSYAHVKIAGRGLSGEITAVCDDFEGIKGPAGRAFKAIRKAYGVHRGQITLSVVEEAYGLGRIEWSVNQ